MKNTITNAEVYNSMKTKTIILAALMTALTCVGTMIIRIPTPTLGYIHPGDGFVLLSSLILGPIWGSLAAGLGSALSDFFAGYIIYVPATFIIKALTALVGYITFKAASKLLATMPETVSLIIAGIAGEAVMVIGYFVFEIFLLADGFSSASLIAGAAASATGIIPNIIQGVFGVIISSILYPLLKRLSSN